jgi:hypothetical protein
MRKRSLPVLAVGPAPRITSSIEQHYKPAEIASLWGFSDDAVRAIYRDEPGVLKINRPKTLHKRVYEPSDSGVSRSTHGRRTWEGSMTGRRWQ